MRRHPDWLKVKLGGGRSYGKVKSILEESKLHTICQEAKCPNMAECFGNGTAVFLILGDICTRNCRYCNVKHGKPLELNQEEPIDVADSVKQLGLKYVVVTSVTRDDLDDGGANVFYRTVREIRKKNENCKIEVLIPDFKGDIDSLKKVIEADPDVINHNIEVVERLFPLIRPEGNYNRSLDLLKNIKQFSNTIKSKSGFMIGIGETNKEIYQTMIDLINNNVDYLTIGQYLQPSKNHVSIDKYYTPDDFLNFKNKALELGFLHVESGPLVRSSYHAEKVFC
jgi:lipoic acid synthetase